MLGANWYLLAGWAVSTLGTALVLTAVFGRRVLVRRTPRCVRCDYRLDGSPVADGSVRCPECGRKPRTPAEPYALGRKGWIGAMGVLLLLVGLGIAQVPTARAQGWRAVLPIGIQLRMLAFSDDPEMWSRVARASAWGRMSEDAGARLRGLVTERLLDPNRNPTPAVSAASLLESGSNPARPAPFDRDELIKIAAEGAPPARSYAVRALGGFAPPTPEQAVVRRQAWARGSQDQRSDLLEWIVRHPAGEEDLEIIRSAFTTDGWRASFAVERAIMDAPGGVHGAVVGLFDHSDPAVRFVAVRSFESWMRDPDNKPPIPIQRRILAVFFEDEHPDVIDAASRMIEDMSVELGAAVGDGLLQTTQRNRVRELLYAIRRRDDPALIPYLERAALQPVRPIEQRLEASEAHRHLSTRTRQPPTEPKFGAIYRDVLDRIASGDPRVLVAIGREQGFGRHPGFLIALAEHLSADGVTAEGLNGWFAARPNFAAVLEHAVPEALDHSGALESLFSGVGRNTHPGTAAELQTYSDRWFLSPDPSPEAGPPP